MYKFDSDAGIMAGLRIWIAFILGFWLAGFRAELCIFLGAIGGIATWRLVTYWKAEAIDLKDTPIDESNPPPGTPPQITPFGRVLRTPESLRKLGSGKSWPRWPARKPPKRI